jgi:hypothetical protein
MHQVLLREAADQLVLQVAVDPVLLIASLEQLLYTVY